MSNNNQSIEFYKEMAKNITDPKEVKLKYGSNNITYDVAFIKKHAAVAKSLLDLGAGTGMIINHLTDDFKEIFAVELFKKFSQYIKGPNITIIHQDILTFSTKKKFDLITLFGVAQCFNEVESKQLYINCHLMLKNKGMLIIKNQFGIHKTKTVTSSTEVGEKYYGQYRLLDYEINKLKDIGFVDITTHDIYPAESNRWKDTHYYAIVCKK